MSAISAVNCVSTTYDLPLIFSFTTGGWSDGAMALGNLPVPGRPTIWIWKVGQRPTALALGAGGGCFDIFSLVYPFPPLSPSLWETARYRLKYCPKGLLNPKPTNQPTFTTAGFQNLPFQILAPSPRVNGFIAFADLS